MICGSTAGDNGETKSGLDSDGVGEALVPLRGPVLVVEDNPTDRRVLGTWLEDLGLPPAELELVVDASQALGVALDRPPRVLVCDWLLPGGPASSLIEHLRRLNPSLITLVLSEHVDRALELAALASGAHEVLAKADCSAMVLGHALRRAERRLEVRRQEEEVLEHVERASRNAHVAAMSRSLVHDIKNLMMATVANLDLVDQDLGELGGAESIRQRTRDAQLAVEQVSEICDDLVRYASAVQQPMQCVEVTEAVHAAVRLLPREARKRVDVRATAEQGREVTVELDPMALRQVVYNLLINAVDATADSGVVTVEVGRSDDAACLEGHVAVSPVPSSSLIFMRVSNGGETLPATLVDEVFKPFFSTKAGSRGLGLAAVRRAVRLMGAGLSLSTGPDRTCFSVVLPVFDVGGEAPSIH